MIVRQQHRKGKGNPTTQRSQRSTEVHIATSHAAFCFHSKVCQMLLAIRLRNQRQATRDLRPGTPWTSDLQPMPAPSGRPISSRGHSPRRRAARANRATRTFFMTCTSTSHGIGREFVRKFQGMPLVTGRSSAFFDLYRQTPTGTPTAARRPLALRN